MATMATPDWFPPISIGTRFRREKLVGGTVGYNNPTREGLKEAKAVFGADTPVASVLSFGSGQQATPKLGNGENAWISLLYKMAFDCERTAIELSQYMSNVPAYHRLSVDREMENLPITAWEEDDLGAISSYTATYSTKITGPLDKIVEDLLKRIGTVTLSQLSELFHQVA